MSNYKTSWDVDTNTQVGAAPKIPAGIQENVTLLDITIEDSKQKGTSDRVLRFHFQNDEGLMFTHTEFPINPDKVAESAIREKKNPQEVIDEDALNQGKRIKHILSCFVPNDKIVIKVKSWEEFMQTVIDIAGKAYVSRKFRLKLILNKKDFPSFPRVVATGFIQPMTVPNSLFINPKYDRIVPKEATPESDIPADPFANMEATDEEFRPTTGITPEPADLEPTIEVEEPDPAMAEPVVIEPAVPTTAEFNPDEVF